MNILVTGANGQLGKCLYDEVYNENRVVLPDDIKWYFCGHDEVNIFDYEEIEGFVIENNIDVIINCAAYTNVEKAEEDRDKTKEVNIYGTKNIASLSRDFGVFVIHISTDYIFDGNRPTPYKECDFPYPINYYGNTKCYGERELIDNASEYVILRTSLVYSEYGENILKKTIKVLESGSGKFTIDQTTSPTYARDLAYCILLLLPYAHKGVRQILHFCNNGVATRYDFAVAVKELYFGEGSDIVVNPCKSEEFNTKAKRPPYSVLDNSLIRDVLELDIPYWRDSLKKCVERLLDRVERGAI